MERWLKVLLGTLFSTIAIVIFFFIYDRIMVYFRRQRHVTSSGPTYTLKKVYRKKKVKNEEEMEKLVYDEFSTMKHEVVCVCTETKSRAVGLCIFLGDREVEWYVNDFPDCCINKSEDEDYKYRNVLAAVAHWAPKFTYAEAVNLLCQDGGLVRNVAKGTTRQWRSFYQFEKKHTFRLFLQWYENYVTGEVANEELWETAIVVAKGLLDKGEDALEDLPLENWKIKRVTLSSDNFHMVPHPGDITPVEGSVNRDSTTDKYTSENNNESDLEVNMSPVSSRKLSFTDERLKSVKSERANSLAEDENHRSCIDSTRRLTSGGGSEDTSNSTSNVYRHATGLRKSLLSESGRASFSEGRRGSVTSPVEEEEEDEVFNDESSSTTKAKEAGDEMLILI